MDSVFIVSWRRVGRDGVWASKLHVSLDGSGTACGSVVPETATMVALTGDWFEYTTCYNCAYRLWPVHGPSDRIRPAHGEDFPPRHRCPHDLDPTACPACTADLPIADPNWPCPNGCTAPHSPAARYPRCTVFPTHLRPDPDGDGRCAGGCESVVRVVRRANPRLRVDLAEGNQMTCYHCSGPVCSSCGTASVPQILKLCDRCARLAEFTR